MAEVSNDVRNVLNANRDLQMGMIAIRRETVKPKCTSFSSISSVAYLNQVWSDTSGKLFFGRKLLMRRRCRVNNKRLRIAHVCKMTC